MITFNSTLLNSSNNDEQSKIKLSENGVKLLELLNSNHDSLYHLSSNKQDVYVQVTLRVEELNKIAEGISTLASIIALNPNYKSARIN